MNYFLLLRSSLIRSAALALSVVGLIGVSQLQAQFSGPTGTQVHDSEALKPPPGARVAIIEFEDMERPDCRAANPLLKEASEQYHIPWVRHDFPLPFHPWSLQAAVNARWFDTKSKKIGDDYRDQVFANQPNITSPEVLRTFTEKFAKDHDLALPFAVDPEGKLTALVKADYALGQKVGIEHTPTIWVSTSQSKGAPFIEVVDRSKLFQLIDQALADTSASK